MKKYGKIICVIFSLLLPSCATMQPNLNDWASSVISDVTGDTVATAIGGKWGGIIGGEVGAALGNNIIIFEDKK